MPFDDITTNFYISSYRPVGQGVDVHVWELDSFFNDDDPFSCKFGYCAAEQFYPRVQTFSGGSMSFPLCEGLPTQCSRSPSDLEVTFKDHP